MDFDLSPEQEDLRAVVRRFADEVVAPAAEEHDRDETFPIEIVKQMGELGFFGLTMPEEFGGSGAGAVSNAIVLEELGRADQSVAITVSVSGGLAGGMIATLGTQAQKERWLPGLATGEILASFALTEPGGGSDAAAARTTARLEDGMWVLDGTKSFITNSGTPITGVHVVAAATEPGGGAHGLSSILVPAGTEGLAVGPPYRKMGWHASDTHELSFADCRVPEENLLGERGRGFAQALGSLTGARISIAAVAVGLAQACLEQSVSYATEREAFGRPLGAFQLIQAKVADMRAAVDGARLLTYRAAWLKDQGRPHTAEAALAKLVASESAVDCARDAVQIHGGYGYIEEYPVARLYRDAKVLEIGEGTSEVQRLIIARDLGLKGS
jgi:alkylation response protein AidB-like acyl-CoA dehydrogenase